MHAPERLSPARNRQPFGLDGHGDWSVLTRVSPPGDASVSISLGQKAAERGKSGAAAAWPSARGDGSVGPEARKNARLWPHR
jgi:hypothetical protein